MKAATVIVFATLAATAETTGQFEFSTDSGNPFLVTPTIALAVPPDGSFAVRSPTADIEAALYAKLFCVPHVDGAYMQEPDDESGIVANVLAREHGVIDRESLLAIEDELAALFKQPVTLIVRAHQGRDMRSMAGPNLLFARG